MPTRPNKTARGMTKTAERSRHNIRWLARTGYQKIDALTLSVRGTLDVLGQHKYDRKVRTIRVYSLNDNGRRRLERLRLAATRTEET